MAKLIDRSAQKYKAEYKENKFKNEKAFKDWLKKKAVYKVDFVDNGQDCLTWWLDKGGEVLHSNLQASVWNGGLVDLWTLKVGQNIEVILVEERSNRVYNFVIEQITILKNGNN